jgi:hypothetical protein
VVNTTPRPLYPRKRYPVPILQEAGRPHGLSGRVRIMSPPPGFDPRTVQLVTSRYTDYAIPANHAKFYSRSKAFTIKHNLMPVNLNLLSTFAVITILKYIYSYQSYSLNQHFTFHAYLGYRFRLKEPSSSHTETIN